MLARLSKYLLIILLVAVLAGCAGEGSSLPPLESGQAGPYALDSGDVVRMIVFVNEDLSGEYAVDGAGIISVPLLGAVEARGLSTRQLDTEMETRLANEILIDPSVSIQVVSFRPFFILGEVQNPGQFPYVNQMTVLTAVALAGGYTYRAEKDYAKVIRNMGGEAVERRAEPSSFVQPGDVIYVYERLF